MIEFLKRIRRLLMWAGRKAGMSAGYVRRRIITPKIPRNVAGKVYVNLGCGVNTSDEFINIDARAMPNVHFIHEVQHLPMLKDDSVDLLYASHLVEHIPRDELKETFFEWKRVLKPGGILRIGVPDFDKLVEVYRLSGNAVESIVNQLLGQDAPYDDHHTIWNFDYARELFEGAGFHDIRRWDPANAGHHAFTDKTGRSMIVNGQGISISLNVEAMK